METNDMSGQKDTREKKSVLIIEDEPDESQMLVEGFTRSEVYDFQVETAVSPRDLLKKGLYEKRFDVSVIDVNLSDSPFSGLDVVLEQNYAHPGSLTIIYSAHPDMHSVIKGIRSGAVDFIDKRDCPPNEIIPKIEEMLNEQSKRRSRRAKLDELMKIHGENWQQQYAGRVIAVQDEDIVASGTNRLEALINYAEKHPASAQMPDLIGFPMKS